MEEGMIEFVDTDCVLTKNCTEGELRQYFTHLLTLYRNGEQYPVDLDDVWMLVYSAKNKAVRALKASFVEGEDFNLTQNGQEVTIDKVVSGVEVKYRLSTSCFEYFIAKKVRNVFNVYREVFKKVATGEVVVAASPKTSAEMLLMYAQQMVESEKRMNAIESKQQEIEEKVSEIAIRTKTDIQYSTIVGFASRFGIKVPLERASTLGRVAKNICRQYQLETGIVPDPRFGCVRTYPESVLYDTFEKYYPNVRFR